MSEVGVVISATSGWTVQHAVQPKTTESTASTWSVTFLQPSATMIAAVETTETTNDEQTSQPITHTSSMPPATISAVIPSTQDTTMTKSSTKSSSTKSTSTKSTITKSSIAPMNTGVYPQISPEAATKTGSNPTIGQMSTVTSNTAI